MSALRPAVFTVPSEIPFLEALAEGLIARYFLPGDPASLAAVTVLLPTRRAARGLGEHLLAGVRARGAGTALLLPEIRPLGDVDEDALAFGFEDSAPAEGLPDPLPPLRRRLLLMRLVEAWSAARARETSEVFSAAQAFRLAGELEALIDRAETQGVALGGLGTLAPPELSAHWAEIVVFLDIVGAQWPAIETAEGTIGPARRRALLLAALTAAWQAHAPAGPVIAAGSTGTIPATAALLRAVASLPQGAVLLPGLDQGLDEQAWAAVDASHPQGAMKALLQTIGLARDEIALWPHGTAAALGLRARLLNEALRPWAATGGWRAEAPGLKLALAEAEPTGLGVHLVAAAHQGEEASLAALILREALETPGQSAALVTPDRRLARAVRAELERWDILVDDSAGTPLTLTPPGIFMRLLAEAAAERLAPVPLLALLKHPVARLGFSAAEARRQVRALERCALRGPRPGPGIDGLLQAIDDRMTGEEAENAQRFVNRLAQAAGRFATLFDAPGLLAFSEILSAHIEAAEALMRNEAGADGLWRGEAGEALELLLGQASGEAANLPTRPPSDYPSFFEALLSGAVVRPNYGIHPRLFIWGPLEARLQKADIVVLGGLNEGSWPTEPAGDPWMSRGMMAALGLPPPEQRLGLSAHDFVQCASAAKRAYFTRALKVDGAPAVASRWIVRLETILSGLDRPEQLAPLAPWRAWAGALDTPAARVPPATSPRPAPPLAARPRSLSVTEIEQWVRDPYAIYAKHVLKLARLDPLDAPPDAALRGRIIHEIMEAFARHAIEPGAPDALERLLALGHKVFDAYRVPHAVRAFWGPRFEDSAQALIEVERENAAHGETLLGVEVKGTHRIRAAGGPFSLRARADRIDRAADGSLIISDYKTGTPPSLDQMKSGLAPQLPLEAVIASAGGFEGIDPGTVSRLRVIRLMGGEKPLDVRPINDATTLAAQNLAELHALIARYDDPAYPYRARPVPKFLRGEGLYDHLARVKEWSSGDAGEGDP